MNRYNVFNQVHKGLRGLLYETAQLLQQTDFSSREQGREALDKLVLVLELFEKHAHSEDNYLLPALEQYEPSVVTVFEEEHDKDHELGHRLEELIFVFNHSLKIETAIETGKTINNAFVEFMVFNLEHMAKEERVLNKLLWRYYTDDQLQGMTQEIVKNLSPEIMTKYSRCMMRGLNNQEIINWLKQVQRSAPAFVFEGLAQNAEMELDTRRWLDIKEQVMTEALVTT